MTAGPLRRDRGFRPFVPTGAASNLGDGVAAVASSWLDPTDSKRAARPIGRNPGRLPQCLFAP